MRSTWTRSYMQQFPTLHPFCSCWVILVWFSQDITFQNSLIFFVALSNIQFCCPDLNEGKTPALPELSELSSSWGTRHGDVVSLCCSSRAWVTPSGCSGLIWGCWCYPAAAAQMLCADVMLFLLTRISLGHVQALCLALLLGRASKQRTMVTFPQFSWNSVGWIQSPQKVGGGHTVVSCWLYLEEPQLDEHKGSSSLFSKHETALSSGREKFQLHWSNSTWNVLLNLAPALAAVATV